MDLGIVKYPTYNCIILEHIFSNESDLLAYEEVLISLYLIIPVEILLPFATYNCNVLQAIEVAQVIDQSLDENNFELVLRCIMIADSRISCCPEKLIDSTSPDLMAILRSRFSASWVYSKVILLGISFLEFERRYGA